MNRLQKKCLVASTGFHGLLIGVTIFGAAFFVPREKSTPSVPIKVYYPDDVVDKPTAGGNPAIKIAPPARLAAPLIPTIKAPPVEPPIASTPPVAPPIAPLTPPPEPAKPLPEPTKAPTPAFDDEPPPKPKAKVRKHREKPAPEKEEKPKDEKPKPVEDPPADPPERPAAKADHGVVIDTVSLTPVVRETAHKSSRKPSVDDEQAANDARAEAEYQAAQARAVAARAEATRRAHEIGRLVQNLSSESSSSTKVEMPGPGGPNTLSANYRDIVWSIYHEHWRQPSSVSDKGLKVEVRITIARDGRVVGKHIVKPSGNADMDRSIERTLDSVKFVEAFPAGVTDEERSFKITFDLESDQ